MNRKVLVAGLALAGLVAVACHPAMAGSCAVLTEGAIGLKQAETADRAQKQLSRKINRWMAKNGYKYLKSQKISTSCSKTGSVARCIATAKVCG